MKMIFFLQQSTLPIEPGIAHLQKSLKFRIFAKVFIDIPRLTSKY